jgi:5-methylcytosine-specific restriction enzyme A
VARALKACPCIGCAGHDGGCPELVATRRCDRCSSTADQARGSAARRGYGHQHRTRFRKGVLRKHPLCVCPDEHRNTEGQGHGKAGCLAPSVHADHHPRGRDELIALHLDPDDPQYGRGLCGPCHNWHTSQAQPGGWNAR